MNKILANTALVLMPAIDIFLMVAAVPAGAILLLYRRIGSKRLPWVTSLLKKIGVFPIRNHYYEPLFDDRHLTASLNQPRPLPGIDFDIQSQLQLLLKLCYAEEFVTFMEEQRSDESGAILGPKNKSFKSGDAEFLFQMVRHFEPAKVMEIGSGTSTKIVRRALSMNARESGSSYRHICIEPYEMPWLETLGDIELIRDKVEDCGLDWSEALSEGDLLFIDSSHIIRPQGDVLFEYLNILPRLQSGVIVHVHDIFSPRDYLEQWVKQDVRFWNEQYLLEATLANSSRYKVLAALNQLKHDHFEELKRVCPYLTREREPGSFYFQVR
jgi:hypothetical protein